MINGEGGEGMVNATSMRNPMIAQEVLRLNNLGTGGGSQSYGGNSGINADTISTAIIKSITAIPVTVTEYHISKAQREVKIRQERFTQK